GLATYAVKDDFITAACCMSKPETIFFAYKNHQDILKYIKQRKISSIAVGPGLVESIKTREFILKIISSIELPMVLDASGLASFAGAAGLLKKAKAKLILTPHEGEFSKLVKIPISQIRQDSKRLALEFAKENNLILVLKRHNTIVTDGKSAYINDSGTPAMASAGSGDVLSGIISAFCSIDSNLFEAAKFSVWLHGLGGQLAQKEKGFGIMASDISENLPNAILKFVKI
ncbi:MAG: NAD(P)H-hydrate dehydratase, partial [Elusimicrobiota bacterium]|nr:NAD(P)H-hydrate dehydratase [Elusimicrobiota bacterium]